MISDYNSTIFWKYVVWFFAGAMGLWMLSITFPAEASAFLVVLVTSGIALACFRHYTEDKEFITTLFVAALAARLGFGLLIYVTDLQDFFGGDAFTYHAHGAVINDYWNGLAPSHDPMYLWATLTSRPGWGMNYVVAGIYFFTGNNMLAGQSFCAVIGAATVPMVYFCAQKIFSNNRVARVSALGVAFFPSFIIWSGQLMKDGMVIFLLVVAMTMVLELQGRINYAAIAVLIISLFGIVTIRFYIFYMVAVAVAGSFIVGVSHKSTSILRRATALIFIGMALTYLGVIRNATAELERYSNLERIQISRMDMSRRAKSGFNEGADVSTAEGAITSIPLGFAYLMFAPFPWQVSSFRQAITLPEVLLWWAMIPLMIYGIIFAVRHRLRSAFPILFFSIVLTLAYSIFQGNVGTAYRQRTQIQVFLFIFIGVGWALWKEKREDKKAEELLRRKRLEAHLRPGQMEVIR